MSVKDILKDLVKFDTVKDKENEKIINYIEQILKNKEFKTEYKSNCLIMSIKSKSNLGFLGHTDTVGAGNDWDTNPFELQEKDGILYGLGVCDMKGGIAAILQAVLETDWENLRYGIKLYFTYDEEINFLGIKELIQKKESFPNNIIIGEPTNNIIMNGSKGLLELKLVFNGISAHSSMPDKGENAIEKCMDFLNELKVFYNQLKGDKSNIFEIEYTTMNIGKINGGKSVNIVPSNCEVLVDFRIVKNDHISLILNKINELTQKYKGTYEIINNIKPFINQNEKIYPTNFITEASFIECKNKYILGAGPINPHKANEYITIKSLERLIKQYKEAINKFCQ